MRLLLISLGVTCLASVILFLYFRNRISRMEQKVDLMFQLIQEYEQTKNTQTNFVPTMAFESTQQGGDNQPNTNLINVSDDDEEYTDSDEVSDEEEASDSLNIEAVTSVADIKSISLSGAEIESLKVEPGDDLDEISDMEDENVNDVIHLEEVVNNGEEDKDLVDNIEDLQKEEYEENNELENNTVQVKKIDLVLDKPLPDMTVKELKEIAGKKGFTNYKGLRKNKLVELLTTSQ